MEPHWANSNCVLSQFRYGVRDSFTPEDLLDCKNVPQVTRCVEELAKLVKNCNHYLIDLDVMFADIVLHF